MDVHDIGKNYLVVILTNNGYTVFNLGIKQPLHDILHAAREKSAHAIGMSGLLVKSVAVMKENLEELNAANVAIPVLLGGAALTRDYAEETLAELYHGPLLYCKDAFEGLHAMDEISGGKVNVAVDRQRDRAKHRKALRAESDKKFGHIISGAGEKSGPPVATDNPIPTPPFWGRRVVANISPNHAVTFINKTALYTGQWGFKQKGSTPEQYRQLIAEKADPVFESLKRQAMDQKLIEPKVVYGYFPVQSEGDELVVYHPEEFPVGSRVPAKRAREWMRFSLPRQSSRRRLCITDFFRSKASGEFDVLGVQVVTVGDHATEAAEKLRRADKYQDYLYLHGFGVESAEGLAEYWHKYMRQELGFASERTHGTNIELCFIRGIAAADTVSDIRPAPIWKIVLKLSRLLHPEAIGVQLSENFMMIPEQSTDALVVHQPQAKYFDA